MVWAAKGSKWSNRPATSLAKTSTKLDAGLLLCDLGRLVTARATGGDLKQQRRAAAGSLSRRVKLDGMCSLSSDFVSPQTYVLKNSDLKKL